MIYASDIIYPDQTKKLMEETDLGIESLEFSISENLDHLEETIQRYKKCREENGIKNLTLHGPFLDLNPVAYDSKIQDVTMQRFNEAYYAAQQVGAEKIIYHTGFVPSIYFLDGWAERMADFMNRFMENKSGIQVLLENVYDPFPEPLLKVRELVDSLDFKLCLDVGHANCYSRIPVMNWIECLGSSIGHVHLHDNDGIRDAHLALGKGTLPVEEMLGKLKSKSGEITYAIECSEYQDVIQSCEILKEYGIIKK